MSKRIHHKREPFVWTAERDALIRQRRAQGRSYPAIAAELGLSPTSVARHAIRALGLPAIIGRAQRLAVLRKLLTEDNRQPLPPGDPISWGLLLSLTPSLGNIRYPRYRPLLRRRKTPAVERTDDMRLAA
jgi:hypothetical protein